MKLHKVIFFLLAFFVISPHNVSGQWMLAQLGIKYSKNPIVEKLHKEVFYAGSVVAWIVLNLTAYQLQSMGKKLQHYNPALKKEFNDSTLDRVFTRLMIIRRIKAEIEVKTGIKTTWHIMEEDFFNAFALGSKQEAMVSFTEVWLTTNKLTNIQFERYLKAIMMHELGHVAHSHTSKRLLTSTLQLALSNFILYYAEKSRPAAVFPLEMTAVLLDILIPKYISRMNEYQADAFATTLTDGADLKEALEFIHPPHDLVDLANPILGLLSTHPPVERRGNRLLVPNIAQKSVWTDAQCYKWW